MSIAILGLFLASIVSIGIGIALIVKVVRDPRKRASIGGSSKAAAIPMAVSQSVKNNDPVPSPKLKTVSHLATWFFALSLPLIWYFDDLGQDLFPKVLVENEVISGCIYVSVSAVVAFDIFRFRKKVLAIRAKQKEKRDAMVIKAEVTSDFGKILISPLPLETREQKLHREEMEALI